MSNVLPIGPQPGTPGSGGGSNPPGQGGQTDRFEIISVGTLSFADNAIPRFIHAPLEPSLKTRLNLNMNPVIGISNINCFYIDKVTINNVEYDVIKFELNNRTDPVYWYFTSTTLSRKVMNDIIPAITY